MNSQIPKNALKVCLRQFREKLLIEKHLSKSTLDCYERDIRKFIDYCSKDLSRITLDDFSSYSLRLKSESYAFSSLCRFFFSIKRFFKFLKSESIIKENFLHAVEVPKKRVEIPSVLSYEEIKLILDQPDLTKEEGLRDKAILETIYASGLKASEVCRVNVGDISNGFILIRGREKRFVPIGRMAIQAINDYLPRRKSSSNVLFLNKRRAPINRFLVWGIIKKYAKAAGITKTVSPNTLRHSFALHLLEGGMELVILQNFLGHADISITEKYLSLCLKEVQSKFNKYHRRR